ncbi:CRISPR-associated protein Cmr5 [Azospirillaceae bacterium]
MKTLDQRRAAHAWTIIDSIRDAANRKDVTRAAKKLPLQIMTAGLGHALAFVKAKGKAPRLIEGMSEWALAERNKPDGNRTQPAKNDAPKMAPAAPSKTLTLSGQSKAPPSVPLGRYPDASPLKSNTSHDIFRSTIIEGNSDTLRCHTAEVLAWLMWFNRFAEAEFPKDVEEGGD